MDQSGELPWFDQEKQELRPINVQPSEQPPRPPDVAENMQDPDEDSGMGGMAGFGFWAALQMLGWAAIAALIILILIYLLATLLGRRTPAIEAATETISETHVDRVEKLPFQVARGTSDLLGEARRCFAQGDYNQAIVYLFSHQLVELDKHNLIRLTRGKTNRQYLRELGEHRELQQLLQQTMIAFEDVFFGDHPLTRPRCEACFRQLEQFQRLSQLAPA